MWDELWNYQPPEEMALLRKARREERAREPVELGVEYLLRAVEARTSDTLPAFRMESILEDGSVVLAGAKSLSGTRAIKTRPRTARGH